MQMVTRPDPQAALSEALERLAAAAKAKGGSLRVRIQPTMLNHETKMYVALPGVSWLFDLSDTEAVGDMRASLDAFFAVMQTLGGARAMREYMGQVEAAVKGMRAVGEEG